ncbi:MAG: DUF6115 domain-containing protein [Lachnospiraceae bacterium]
MSAMEIVLIIMGVVIFLLGYLLPGGKKKPDEEVQLISEDEVRKMVAGEIEGARDKISDIVDETVNYSIEKTERALERVTNEKIMAVNEYSDTVLEEINKNHKEVVFLYDMLNDKHDNLMSTINEATQATDGIKQTVKDAEITANEAARKVKDAEDAANEAVEIAKEAVAAANTAAENIKDVENTAREARETVQSAMQSVREVANKKADLEELHNAQPYHADVVEEVQNLMKEEQDNIPVQEEEPEFKPISPRRVEIIHEPDGDYVAEGQDVSTSAAFAQMGIFAPKKEEPAEPKRKTRTKRTFKKENEPEESRGVDIQFTKGMDNNRNSNERILELHKAGKSNMAIAKELGLGLGEVKLVIDLFEGI